MPGIKGYEGRLLISLTDGKNLGEVKDLYLDSEARRAMAIYLGKTGLLSRKEQMIDLKHVRLYGIDAWLVAGSDLVIARQDFPGAESYQLAGDLIGREIQTEGGTRLGTIGDVIVDESGEVLGFAFGKLYFEGPLADSKAISRAAVLRHGEENTPAVASLEEAEKSPLPAPQAD